MKTQIQSLHVLRGFSALMVIIYHHGQFFWTHQRFCSRLANKSPITETPFFALFLESLPINLGDLGVAIFFLISGFLMVYIAPGKMRLNFIQKRMMRIWPAYVGALFLLLSVVGSYSLIQGRPIPWKEEHLLASLFLMRDVFGYPFIDGIVWTLEIELKFYLLCTLLLPWLQNKPIAFIGTIFFMGVLSGLLWAGREVWNQTINPRYLWLFMKSMKFISFISLGSLLCFVSHRKIRVLRGLGLGLVLGGIYASLAVYANLTLQSDKFSKEIISYVLGITMFLSAVWVKRIEFLKSVTEWLGTRSYSLYLTHGVLGFVMMYSLMDLGINSSVTILLTIGCCLVGAHVFCSNVEKLFLKKTNGH